MAQWSRYNLLLRDTDDGALFFNTRTGALLRLSPERRRQLTEPDEITPDFLDALLHQGFLLGDDVDEFQLIVERHEAARANRDLFSVTVELTEACNFRCLYCYQSHTPEHLQDGVTEKVLRYLSRTMREYARLHVNWFGGEPLLRLATLEHMARRISADAAAAGCAFSQFITTNGYLMTPAVAHKLADIGITNVQITLDGDAASHDSLRILASGKGTYEQVLAGCRNAVAAGMELLLRVNVNRWNADRFDRLLSDLVAHGLSPDNTVIHATRCVDHGNCNTVLAPAIFTNEEFAREWVNILHVVARYGFNLPTLAPIAYNCPFDLEQTVMIGRDGSVRYCSSSDGRIADLTDAGEEANRTERYHTIKARRPWDDPWCKDCRYLPMCMGGCAYLQEKGQEKCIPERYILPELIQLTTDRARRYATTGQRETHPERR